MTTRNVSSKAKCRRPYFTRECSENAECLESLLLARVSGTQYSCGNICLKRGSDDSSNLRQYVRDRLI